MFLHGGSGQYDGEVKISRTARHSIYVAKGKNGHKRWYNGGQEGVQVVQGGSYIPPGKYINIYFFKLSIFLRATNFG